ncbi:Integrase core domain protein [Crateriforma conspicua]|uniref:Integrase core domain protein n=1 Tax=Crateriforma conspicua TaxID=2527996 RepID=A0A5C6FK04_9PLAN|nr:IS3 family transposase [Crateriforma conspicua]TWU62615.1 Integrase core domain protein [Crateriforma conspicua]
MARTRRRFDSRFKAKVALDAVRELRTISELAKQFKVHPSQVTLWKKQLLSGAEQVFESSGGKSSKSDEPEAGELYEQIGRLKVELEWLKKKLPRTREESLKWIDRDHSSLSVRRQCALLGIARSQLYYEPVPEKDENLELMRLIDGQYLKTPFWGSRNMTVFLRGRGYTVNRKRTQRLMGKMGLEGLAPGPSTSRPAPGHKVYPFLLKDLVIERPNQVWSSDITYVPLQRGFLYLVAVMDWYSRHVLSWRLSNSLEVEFCVEALDEALNQGSPEIFNTDQGSQFTSGLFTDRLSSQGIRRQ